MNHDSRCPRGENKITLGTVVKKLIRILFYNWPWKLVSVLLAIALWGGLISQDATLTREKTFNDVNINIINADTLLRKGLIIVDGLESLKPIKIRAAVPQKTYESATATTYNVRIDLSRISSAGVQTVPIIYSSTASYGSVTWLSTTEITLEADDYIIRRRIPVQLNEKGTVPSGFFAKAPHVDPSTVTVSGPRSIIQNIVRCTANYNLSLLTPAAKTQSNAVPFTLYTTDDKPVSSKLITVTSESIELDTLLVEQSLYRLQPIVINTSGIITGSPKKGYHVANIKVDPSMLDVAGSDELMATLTMLDIETPLDISGISNTIIRTVKVKKPQDAYHMSESAVYVTVTIEADPQGGEPK